MGRTYRKNVRIGTATGRNTEYYRSRNHVQRHVNNSHLRELINQYDTEEIDENISFMNLPKRNTWDEPTDGSHTYTKNRSIHCLR